MSATARLNFAGPVLQKIVRISMREKCLVGSQLTCEKLWRSEEEDNDNRAVKERKVKMKLKFKKMMKMKKKMKMMKMTMKKRKM
jgi:hypothetical protein